MQKRILMVNEDTGSFSSQASYNEMSSAIDRETLKRKIPEEQDFSESETEMPHPKKLQPSNGKKTKGRVKIKMEFIDNKLRRYTTFSKRKTGIMKKAYELSTLTGTQVMVLVASETGHVYTFATRKLQPMITSEAGKSLIQTCLNSPDPLLEASTSSPDQRMSAAGYEETELSYNVDDTENKTGMKTFFVNQNGSTSLSSANVQSVTVSPAVGGPITSLPSPLPSNITAIPLFTSSALGTNSNNNNKVATTPPAISMQIPQSGFTTILAPGATLPQAASTLQIGTLQSASQNQISNSQQTSSNSQSPLLRISPASLVSLPVVTSSSSKQVENSVTVVPSTRPNVSVMPGNMILPATSITPTSTGVPNTVMYQAPQGVVYAPSSTNLPERVILNLSLQSDQGQQLYMPVPVSLTPAHQKVTGTLTAKVAVASVSSPLVASKLQKCRK